MEGPEPRGAGPHILGLSEGGGGGTGSRIDRFYVSSNLAALPGASSTILPTAPISTDHLPVVLTMPGPVCSIPNASSRWHFPVYLLAMPEFVSYVRDWLASVLSPPPPSPPLPPSLDRWLVLKAKIKDKINAFVRDHRLRLKREEGEVNRGAEGARRAMVQLAGREDPCFAVHWGRWRAECEAAERLQQGRYEAREQLQRVHQLLYGAQHINLYKKQARPPTQILHLHDYAAPANAPSSDAADLSSSAGMGRAYAAVCARFGDLFRHRPPNPAAETRLLSALPPIPPTSPSSQNPSLLTLAELTAALRRTGPGRSPGLDGLPFEFYRAFWPQLGPFLLGAINGAHQLPPPPSSTSPPSLPPPSPLSPLLVGLLILILKSGKPRDRVISYRGLTLLGCDIKLVSLVIADRLLLPLDAIVDELQGAFIPGRDIGEVLLLRLGLLDYFRAVGHPIWFIMTDLSDAYDSVKRSYLYEALEKQGVDVGNVRWVQNLLNGTTAQPTLNGQILPPIPTDRGTPQGSPLSPLLFVAALNPLHKYLNSMAANGRLLRLSIPLPNSSPSSPPPPPLLVPPLLPFADDMAHIESASHIPQNGPIIEEALRLNEEAMGTILSVPKCHAIPEGGREEGGEEDRPLTLPLGTGLLIPIPREGEIVRHLGVPIAPSLEDLQLHSFGHQEGALIGKAAAWSPLHPRLFERVHIARTFLLSTLVFQCRFLSPSPAQILAIQAALRSFLRHSDLPEEAAFPGLGLQPRESIWALPRREGGMGMPDVGTFSSAMAARTVALLFSSSSHPWRAITLALLRQASPRGANHAAWLVTAPNHGRSSNPRLQALASAIARLGVFRIVHPSSQSFFSVMTEPVQANRQILLGPLRIPLSASHFQSIEAQSWRHLRDVRRSYLASVSAGFLFLR